MRKYLLQLICLAIISTTIYSCKLDPAILPGQPGYVYVAPPTGGGTGTGTGTGGTISPYDDAALTGTWKVTTTTTIEYVDGVAQSSPSPINLFIDAQMDDAAKTVIFGGSFVVDDVTPYPYVVSKTSSGALYIQLSADPYERSSNGPIQIQSLTATTMTWLAIDPLVITSQGHKLQSAWQMTFTKE
jgi:hypothetical protein